MTQPSSAPPALAQAFLDPDLFVHRWHREGEPYPLGWFVALASVALVGTALYGVLLAWPDHLGQVALFALYNSVSATIAWAAPLPALYILGSLQGLRLRASTLFLASLVTAAWGGLALLSMAPITAVFLLCFPHSKILALFVHGVAMVFVATSMAVIFGRTVERIEPGQGNNVWWLWLFVLLKVQLMYCFGLIHFNLN